jgi:hypothetical protein
MPLRGIRRIAGGVACAALLLAACSDSITFDQTLTGSYKLLRINGSALPYVLPGTPAGTTATVKSGSLIIQDNARFTEVINTHLVTPDTTTESQAKTIGDVSAANGSVTFSPRFENGFSGTYTASTVTYSKQPSAAVTLTFEWEKTVNP